MKRNNLFIGILALLMLGCLLSCDGNGVHDSSKLNKDKNIEIKHYTDTINNNVILTTVVRRYSSVSVSTLKLN